jgi:hypothetical protein
MLATAKTKNSWSNILAMLMVVAGTDVSGLVVGGMVEEVEARVPFFRSASESRIKFSGKLNPLIRYPVFIHNKEENIED